RPAVSTRVKVVSPRRRTVSIESRVVPGTSETMTRSWPTRAFRRLDFPTFGRPRMATRIACPLPVAVSGGDRPWPAESERVELEGVRVPGGIVDLVGDDDDGLARPAQDGSDLLVAGG